MKRNLALSKNAVRHGTEAVEAQIIDPPVQRPAAPKPRLGRKPRKQDEQLFEFDGPLIPLQFTRRPDSNRGAPPIPEQTRRDESRAVARDHAWFAYAGRALGKRGAPKARLLTAEKNRLHPRMVDKHMRDVRKDDADFWKAACRLARKNNYDKLMRLGKAR